MAFPPCFFKNRAAYSGGQLFKGVQSKTVVDALVQNAAQLGLPLHNEHVFPPLSRAEMAAARPAGPRR